jgi:tRNA threonylcarbamoyladenosine biosynthesis protein TsaE
MSGETDVIYTSDSVEATKQLGRRIGQAAEPMAMVALIGPLGAGKTQLVKGIAIGLGVADERAVCSPTFVIVRQHMGRLRLYHADAYRVSSPELAAIGFLEMCSAGGIVVLEWADRVLDLLPDDRLSIHIDPTGAEQRTLTCRAGGERSRRFLERVAPQ